MKVPKIQVSQKPQYMKFAQDVDFYELFEKIESQFATCFLFESLGPEGHLARYSILGFDPSAVIRAQAGLLFIDDRVYDVGNPYETLRAIVPGHAIARQYAGGLIGFVGYDCVNYFEPKLRVKTHAFFDQFAFGVYKDGLILDKITNELYYFYYEENRMRLIRSIMKRRLRKQSPSVEIIKGEMSKREHKQVVQAVKEEIVAGNTFQTVVGFPLHFRVSGDSIALYERLRKVNPSPFMYYLKFSDKRIIGASPELLFRLENAEMETFPLAGTIRRGKSEREDRALARKLLSDPKEIAEHNMLVDLHRNDLGRVAEFGTVKVRNLMGVKQFSHVQHIASEVTGVLREDQDSFLALASTFPAGTVTGAPKIESMRIIDRLEKEPRGPYAGAVGHFEFNGDCTFAIAIRSIFVSGKEGYTQAASGIVYDSDPEKEYDEVRRKLAAMEEVLQ